MGGATCSGAWGPAYRLWLGLLVPGYGLVKGDGASWVALTVTWVSAVGVAVLGWGTVPGVLILCAAFGLHAATAREAIRASVFPPLGSVVPWAASVWGMGLIYAPAVGFLWVSACPVHGPEGERYWVNRLAYVRSEPRAGDRIFLNDRSLNRCVIARCYAGPGDEVEFLGGRLRVRDRVLEMSEAGLPGDVSFRGMRVPEGHAFVGHEQGGGSEGLTSHSFSLEPLEAVVGEVWLQVDPILPRRAYR